MHWSYCPLVSSYLSKTISIPLVYRELGIHINDCCTSQLYFPTSARARKCDCHATSIVLNYIGTNYPVTKTLITSNKIYNSDKVYMSRLIESSYTCDSLDSFERLVWCSSHLRWVSHRVFRQWGRLGLQLNNFFTYNTVYERAPYRL